MKLAAVLVLTLSSLAAIANAQKEQTWGCPARDYKCQLDSRMKALQDDPKNPENYYNLGLVFQRSGAYKEAIESYTMYLSIPGVKPELQAEGYNNRGVSYRASKRPELAIADYQKAISLKPGDGNFLLNRANANSDLGKADEAMADYNQAVQVLPKWGFAYAQRANFHHRKGRVEDALLDYAKAIELEPSYPEPYYNRGVLYFERKEFAKAIPDLDKYISLVADNPAFQADGYLNRAISHFYTGSKDRAVADLIKVIELQPQNVRAYRARAAVYRDLKKNDLADADERKAAEMK
jgi:tetratricopeptide (TPR) repeat protein